MSRPRIATVVSTGAASAAAFVVVRHWGLVGTATGAALIPIIYTLISPWSSAGLERAGTWLWRKLGRQNKTLSTQSAAVDDNTVNSQAESTVETAANGHSGKRLRTRKSQARQWAICGLALVALGLSLYSLASSEETVVKTRETVVVERVLVQNSVDTSVGANAAASDSNSTTWSSDSSVATNTATTDTANGSSSASTAVVPDSSEGAPSEESEAQSDAVSGTTPSGTTSSGATPSGTTVTTVTPASGVEASSADPVGSNSAGSLNP